MANKVITFTLGAEGVVTPTTEQKAGNQGSHNVTEVRFDVSALGLSENHRLRIQFIDGAGGFYSTGFLDVADNTVSTPLSDDVTNAGGLAYVYLVVSEIIYNGEDAPATENQVLISSGGKLRFTHSGVGSPSEYTYRTRISNALVNAEIFVGQAEKHAEESLGYSNTAGEYAENAASSAENAADSATNAANALQALNDGIASGDFKGDQGPRGPQGEKGDKGDKGEKGDTPDLTNHIRIWQPNTEYKVGDVVIENFDNGYMGNPKTGVLRCVENHTSSDYFDLDYLGGSKWEQETDVWAEYGYRDYLGNLIPEHYATKDEVGDVETTVAEVSNGLNACNDILGLPTVIASGTGKAPSTAYQSFVLCDGISLKPATYTFNVSVDTAQTTKKIWANVVYSDGTPRKTIELNFSEATNGSVTFPESKNSEGVYISIQTSATDAIVSVQLVQVAESSFVKYNDYAKIDTYIGSAITGDVIEMQSHTDTKKTVLSEGKVISSNDETNFTTNDIPVEPLMWYKITASAGYGQNYYSILDIDKNVISYVKSPSGKADLIVNKMVFTPKNAAYIRLAYISTLTGGAVAKCISIKAKENLPSPWAGKFLAISYSAIGVAHTNCLETYISAGHFGFNACKGDVRPTSDGKLIMCHDSGFTFDNNGRITIYNSANAIPIHNLTYDECMSYEYDGKHSNTENNHYQKVCDFDQYLDVCKQYGMTAFVTVRDEYIDIVVPETLRALKAHEMLGDCIINSYTVETLTYIRCLNDLVPLSNVRGTNEPLTEARIKMAKAYGRCALTLVSNGGEMQTYISNNADKITLAHENGVGLMYAQPSTMADIEYVRNNGFTGAQIISAVMPYNFMQCCFKATLENGVATIVDWFNLTRFTADVSTSENVISVSNFKIAGSTRGFNDYIMEVWMNRFPHRISATSQNGNTVSAKWQNNAINITVTDISSNDVISIIVEV